MKTALQIINRAYSKIRVKGEGQSLTSEQISDAIDELNSMVWELDADGLHIGWSDIALSSDQLSTPDWLSSLLENGLAIRMGVEFGVQIDPRIIGMYESAYSTALKRLVHVAKIPFPDTLPTGSGEPVWSDTNKYFIDENEGAIWDETGGYLKDEEGEKLNSENEFSNADRNV